jgi:hypothetical protein
MTDLKLHPADMQLFEQLVISYSQASSPHVNDKDAAKRAVNRALETIKEIREIEKEHGVL